MHVAKLFFWLFCSFFCALQTGNNTKAEIWEGDSDYIDLNKENMWSGKLFKGIVHTKMSILPSFIRLCVGFKPA